jgi:hypothetical protein
MSDIVTGRNVGDELLIANGPAAAAILAAGAGCFALGVLTAASDASKTMARVLIFYNPSGALSGVSTTAVFFWLIVWAILAARWRGKTVSMRGVDVAAFLLLAGGLLLTFPPVIELFVRR